jgi:hypothetical protein
MVIGLVKLVAQIPFQEGIIGKSLSVVITANTLSHLPLVQVPEHGKPQDPQLLAAVIRFTSHPSDIFALQSPNPEVHARTHWWLVHAAHSMWGGVGFMQSLAVSHSELLHLPAEQIWSFGHLLLHPPQFLASV